MHTKLRLMHIWDLEFFPGKPITYISTGYIHAELRLSPCRLLVLNWQPGHYDGSYVFIVEFEVRLIPLSIRQLKVISLEQEKNNKELAHVH